MLKIKHIQTFSMIVYNKKGHGGHKKTSLQIFIANVILEL
jgi:hypothetical protein